MSMNRLTQEQTFLLKQAVLEYQADSAKAAGMWEERLLRKLKKDKLLLQHPGYGRHADVWYAPASAEELFSMSKSLNALRMLYFNKGTSYYTYLKNGIRSEIQSEIRGPLKLPANAGVHHRKHLVTVSRYIELLLKSRHYSPDQEILEQVLDRVSMDRMLAVLEERKEYGELITLRQLKEEFRKGIPEDFTLLFPKARSIMRHFIIHVGGTNTGKTYDSLQDVMASKSGVYLAPLRLLAMENQEKIKTAGIPCSLVTGEEVQLCEGAAHVCATVEKADLNLFYETACIDECQMIADPERGWAWTEAILGLPAQTIHLCTAACALDILKELIRQCEDTWEVRFHERAVPLLMEKAPCSFRKDRIQRYDALIAFSRKKVLELADRLEEMGIHASVIYGALPYRVRKEEVRRYISGETDVVVATDAIGMGMNLPIRRIIFTDDQKFDGHVLRSLNSQEVKQIAGRAGRYGMFPEGYVNAFIHPEKIASLLEQEDPSVQFVGIQLPEKMLYMPGSLSSILAQWDKMEDRGIFRHSQIVHEMAVCEALEANFSLEKEQIYRFLHIPFDESDPELKELFLELVANYTAGKKELYGVETLTIRLLSRMNLQSLEKLYKQLDLCASFYICIGMREHLPQIQWNREKVCDVIAARLKQEKKHVKTSKVQNWV